MKWEMNWAQEIIMEALGEKEREEEKREKREGENVVEEVRIKYLENNAVFIQMYIKSRSRPGLVHKTRLITQNSEVRALACTCEGWQYHHKCWHTQYVQDWAKKHGFM
ncbi:zinc-finger domain protein [Sulfolobales Mexican rudivirus 1]|uniref:SWIM-type domain-containing protein n=1 Tax=Sulfolobales Mexican rod-shaped virus 1 TaxID=2848122 RepID=K4NZF9_9VIRU|nr:zinc-finger domain protein [Sulfolobales Mexican rudivirus 1]AFV51230.1 hypothetical protein [Sulfolobales Mexican rod-shaped virus 1]